MGDRRLGAASAAIAAVGLLACFGIAAAQCEGSCPTTGRGYVVPASAAPSRTYLTIVCRAGDVVEVCGYRLRATGEERQVVWHDLVQGRWYEATVRVSRPGCSYEQTVRIQGGGHHRIDLRDCDLAAKPEPRPESNFGLDVDRLNPGEGQIRGNISRDELLAYVRATDSKPRVTVVAPADAVDRIRKELEALADKALIQVYPPGHWALRRARLDDAQPTTVIIQYPDGVVFATEPYQGPDRVKALIARYESGALAIKDIPTWAWVLGAILLAWIFFRRK